MTHYVLPKLVSSDAISTRNYSRVYGNLLNQIDDNSKSDLYIEIKKATRSLKQNAYIWGVVYPTIRKFMSDNHNKDYSDKAIHETAKEMFLPYRVEVMASREVRIYQTTKELTKTEFSDYIEEIFRWAGGFGCSIPEPVFQWREEQAA